MKPYLKLLALILASGLLLNLQVLSLQLLILVGLILGLGQKSWPRLRLLFWPLLLIIFFQLWSNLPLSSGIKIANLSLLVLLYTSASSSKEISQAFRFLPAGLSLTLTIALNLIPAIFLEAQKIRLVQSSRGRRLIGPLPLIIPLLHRTLQRSQQLALILSSGQERDRTSKSVKLTTP